MIGEISIGSTTTGVCVFEVEGVCKLYLEKEKLPFIIRKLKEAQAAEPVTGCEYVPPRQRVHIQDDNVKWIVNSFGELGVQVGNQKFFMYKGESLQYPTGRDDEGNEILFRRIGKREFGETIWPSQWRERGRREPRYRQQIDLPGLFGPQPDDSEFVWRPLTR